MRFFWPGTGSSPTASRGGHRVLGYVLWMVFISLINNYNQIRHPDFAAPANPGLHGCSPSNAPACRSPSWQE